MSLSLTLKLLRQLSDRQFHSGEALARAVGLSRARVCQALAECRELGVTLHRVPGRGYRLATSALALDEQRIRDALDPRAAIRFALVDEIPSTNAALLAAAARGEDIHGQALLAEVQTAGRGRMGREWISGFGGSLAFSLGWRFEQGAAALSGLSLAVGVALVEALREAGYSGVMLKWPNDLIHVHRKLGGILIEVAGDALGPTTVIVGVGINVRLPAALRERIEQAVVDLGEIGETEPDRDLLFARLIGALALAMETYAAQGFAAFQERWLGLHAYHQRDVRLAAPGKASFEGRVEGVDSDGALLLRTAQGVRRVLAGELSLRSAA